jgi:hypothetical protein
VWPQIGFCSNAGAARCVKKRIDDSDGCLGRLVNACADVNIGCEFHNFLLELLNCLTNAISASSQTFACSRIEVEIKLILAS